MASAHQANSFFWKSINSIDNQGIRVIIMPGSGKSKSHGKLIDQLPEKLLGKGGRELKRPCTVAGLTPSTASLSVTSTPTSNLSAASSMSLTLNRSFCNTVRTLYIDNSCTTPSSQVKSSSKVKNPAYSVNFCNSSDTLAECLKYVTHPKTVPKDQESQLRFLLDQYKTNNI